MKPLQLEMTAFESYIHGSIDFTQLGSGLYLIAGQTGAGKTAIFDAVMFALYGVASGGDRDKKMMHCDLVDRNVDTVVELTFSQDGREYTVQRRLHYPNNGDKPAVKAELTGEGISAMNVPTEVTKRIVALTGMNADQFRKIVMLAQGEFRAFLQDDAQRTEIIRRLVDSRRYSAFTQLLSKTSAALEERRNESGERIRMAVEGAGFSLPAGLPEEERRRFRPDHPQLAEALRELVTADGREETESREALQQLRAQMERKNASLREAERVNGLLNKREEARAELERLTAAGEAMDALRTQLDAAERALHGVWPEEKRLAEARQAEQAARTQLQQNREILAQLTEEAAQAQRKLESLAHGREEIQRLRSRWDALNRTLPQYEQRDRTAAAAAEARKAAEEARARQEAAVRRREENRAEADACQQELAGLADAETRLSGLTYQAEAQQTLLTRLQGPDGLRSRLADLEKQLALGLELNRNCDKLKQEKQRLRSRWEQLQERFRQGQAGFLGDALRQELTACGEASCPVCRTRLTLGQAEQLAAPEADLPTQQEVDRAYKASQNADAAERKAAQELSELRASWQERRKQALALAGELGLAADPKELTEAGRLDDLILGKNRELEALRKERQEAEMRLARKQALEARARQLQTALDLLLREGEEAGKALNLAEKNAADHTAQLEAFRLEYPTLAEAQAELKRIADAADRLEAELQAAENAQKAARERLTAQEGVCGAGEKQLTDCAWRIEACRTAFDGALITAGFGTETAYRQAKALTGGEGEAWIKAQGDRLRAYEDRLKAARTSLDHWQEQTAAYPGPVETAALESALRQDREALDAMEADNKALIERKAGHQAALDTVLAAKKELEDSDAAAARLRRLAMLAANSDGTTRKPKTNFGDYMAGKVFREILEEANLHLNRMTEGKYRLVYRDESRDGRRNSSLLIDVEDCINGTVRDTASLSGGESFQASLALALGLSGTVQKRAGTQQVDAMFIDEGFGTLSDQELSAAVDVLSAMAGSRRQVAIISHVAKLEECVPSKLRVTKTAKGGSRVTVEL